MIGISSKVTQSLILVLLLVCPGLAQDVKDSLDEIARGEIVELSTEHSAYQVFIPKRTPTRILVIAHGTPGKREAAKAVSRKFIERWIEFAARRRLLLISIAFNRENFGSESSYGYGGYRGLFGRKIGADEYAIQLVDRFQSLCSVQDGRFLLYGHSAGGQFLVRFCVSHPNRIAAAVASAPGRFSFPNPEATWPYGMGRFSRQVKWSETERQDTVVEPLPENFRAAAELPIVVVYGERDTSPQPARPAHPGKTRIDYGTGWVEAMNSLEDAERPSISLRIEKGIGHDSAKLTPHCQKALMKLDWVKPDKTEVLRLWRSANKKFKVNAKLVESADGKVILLTSDLKEIEVPLEKLSKADRNFLEKPMK